jgi:hypothetical protein
MILLKPTMKGNHMSIPYSSSKAHNDAQYLAEMTRQVSVAAAGGNQASITAATIAYHRAVGKSALANGVGVEASMSALRAWRDRIVMPAAGFARQGAGAAREVLP